MLNTCISNVPFVSYENYVNYAPAVDTNVEILSIINVSEDDPVYVTFFAVVSENKFAISVSKKLFDFSTEVQYYDTINPALDALNRIYRKYNIFTINALSRIYRKYNFK